MIRIFSLIAALAFATPVLAHGFKVGDLIIAHPYSHETLPTARSGIGYLTLMNNGTEADRLIEVRSPFPKATLHETVLENDVARMISVDGIEIPPGGTVKLEPGGKHIMFMGLDGDPLEVGDTFTVTLVFEKAGTVEIEFWVEDRDPNAPEVDHSNHGVDHSSKSRADEDAVRDQLVVALRTGIEVPSVVVVEDAAVASWLHPSQAGRALFRKEDGAWVAQIISGESLKTQAGLQAQRLSPSKAKNLLEALTTSEANLPADQVERFETFEGTIFVHD